MFFCKHFSPCLADVLVLPNLKIHSLFPQEASLAPSPLGPWSINPACSGRTSVVSKGLATFTRTQPWAGTPSSLDWSTRWCCLLTSLSDKASMSLGGIWILISQLLWERIWQNWVVLIFFPFTQKMFSGKAEALFASRQVIVLQAPSFSQIPITFWAYSFRCTIWNMSSSHNSYQSDFC